LVQKQVASWVATLVGLKDESAVVEKAVEMVDVMVDVMAGVMAEK
jgi:hypothetical protein